MQIIKASFKDKAGYYTMTWSFDPKLWEVKDLLYNEMIKSDSRLLEVKYLNKLPNEKSN